MGDKTELTQRNNTNNMATEFLLFACNCFHFLPSERSFRSDNVLYVNYRSEGGGGTGFGIFRCNY